MHPYDIARIQTTYDLRGESAANDDIRAGNNANASDIDEGMVIQYVGLDDGGAEARALLAEHGADGPEAIGVARDAVLRGYHERLAEKASEG